MQPDTPGVSVQRQCPVCSGGSARELFTKPGVRLVQCAACRMVYATPVRADLLTGGYYDSTLAEYYLSPAKLQSDYAPVRFQRELALFRTYCWGGAVLDVGCSTGGFLHQLQLRRPGAYQLLGADVSGPALDYAASQGVPVTPASLAELAPGNRKFDAITFWAVLEHLDKPADFLRAARELLVPGGLCFVLVPNLDSLAVRLLGRKYRYIYPQHLNYFTCETLVRLVEAQKFSIAATRYTHFNPVVIWQDWRRGGVEVPDAERASLLAKTSRLKQNALLRPLQWVYRAMESSLALAGLADNVALVLKKPA